MTMLRGFCTAARRVPRLRPRVRRFGAGHAHGKPGEFVPPHVADWHKRGGEICMTAMWFWIMYRFRHDYNVLLVSIVCGPATRRIWFEILVVDGGRRSRDAFLLCLILVSLISTQNAATFASA